MPNRLIRDFLVAFLALAAGVPLTIFGIRYFADNITALAVACVALLVLTCAVGYALLLLRPWIQSHVLKVSDRTLAQLMDPLQAATESLIDRDFSSARTHAWELARSLLDRYSWLSILSWIVRLVFGMLLSFTALVGSALLFTQNDLIRKQNDKFDVQNLAIASQNTLLTTQNLLLTEQNRHIKIQSALAEASRRSSLVFELASILDEVDEEIDFLISTTSLRATMVSNDPRSPPNSQRNPTTIPVPIFQMHSPRWDAEPERKTLGPPYEDKRVRLSAQLYGRISAVSRSFKPYAWLDENEQLTSPSSPERGLLIKALLASRVSLTPLEGGAVDLSFADLHGTSLIAEKLARLNLTNADFGNSNLDHADFSGALLKDARFQGSKVSNAIFEEAILPNADAFTGCEFDVANLHDAWVPSKDWLRDVIRVTGCTELRSRLTIVENSNVGGGWHGEGGYTIELFTPSDYGYVFQLKERSGPTIQSIEEEENRTGTNLKEQDDIIVIEDNQSESSSVKPPKSNG